MNKVLENNSAGVRPWGRFFHLCSKGISFLLPEFLDVQSIPWSGSCARNCSVPGSSGKQPRICCVTGGILAKSWQEMSWKVIIFFGHSKIFFSLLSSSLFPADWAVLEPLTECSGCVSFNSSYLVCDASVKICPDSSFRDGGLFHHVPEQVFDMQC